jgi:cyclopropane-fatty-acyl-phospholipid synthase
VSDALVRLMLRLLLGWRPSGTLLVEEGDGSRRYGAGEPLVSVEVRSRRVWRMLLRGSRGLADAYAQRLWDSPDLVGAISLAARNAAALDRLRGLLGLALRPLRLARALLWPSTRRRRRREIAAHYDLGSELFARMLDPTMSYSCAVFERADMSLEEAQLAKLERVCEKLDLRPSDRVLEIGTGWGAFAIHAATTRGCHVTTTTISAEQHAHAVELVRRAGLCDRVTVLMEDYSDLRGRYDKLVSIEMIEAVGWRGFGAFLATCSRLLAPHGAMLLQAITIDERLFELEKASKSFINTLIFPGGCLPSLRVIGDQLARTSDMRILDVEDITADYVQTLSRWREAFAANEGELAAYGYDERFRRLWRLYLAYCQAGFQERRICDFQLVMTKPEWRARTERAAMRGEDAGTRDALLGA